MNDISNWVVDEEPGTEQFSYNWAQNLPDGNVKQFFLVNYTAGNPAMKTRFEIRRDLMTYNKTDGAKANGQISINFDLPRTADGGFDNAGGWVFQTMAWNIRNDANGRPIPRYTSPRNGFYAPLAIVDAWNGNLSLIMYDNLKYRTNTTDGLGGEYYYAGNPTKITISSGKNYWGKTFILNIKLFYHASDASQGRIEAWVDGDTAPMAVYRGITYPAVLPSNQRVVFKTGTYSTFPMTFRSKVGVDFVWVNFPYGGYY
jgi:hypothetical protein